MLNKTFVDEIRIEGFNAIFFISESLSIYFFLSTNKNKVMIKMMSIGDTMQSQNWRFVCYFMVLQCLTMVSTSFRGINQSINVCHCEDVKVDCKNKDGFYKG